MKQVEDILEKQIPDELAEAARVDGARPMRFFINIVVIVIIVLMEGEGREGEIRRGVRALRGRFGAVNGQDNRAVR